VAIDATDEAVLGLVEATIWTRDRRAVTARRRRSVAEKESQRWLTVAKETSERLARARERIVVGDSESDIYALFARHPLDTHLVVRCCQNRTLTDGSRLFDATQAWPVLGRQKVKVAPRGPGDVGRVAEVELRAGVVELCHPRHGKREGAPATVAVTFVEALEVAPAHGATALHWRLMTTLPGTDEAAAADVVRLYRLRWRIEQSFRMLKSDGLKIEEAQTFDPHRLFNLAALAMGAAVRIIQLVDARDGSNRPAGDVASDAEICRRRRVVPHPGRQDRAPAQPASEGRSRLAQLDRRPARRMELLLQAARAENHAPGMGPLRCNRQGVRPCKIPRKIRESRSVPRERGDQRDHFVPNP
jgi:hypothetical protein